jgi:hypothetical protein
MTRGLIIHTAALDVALKRVAKLSGDEALNLESLCDFGRKT